MATNGKFTFFKGSLFDVDNSCVNHARPVGMSLIEVLIALGVMMVGLLGLTSMINYQNREAQGLAEKLARLDAQRLLTNIMADGTLCTYLLAGKTFNSTQALPNPVGLPISPALVSIPISNQPGAPPAFTNSASASGLVKTLWVPVSGIEAVVTKGSAGNYEGEIRVKFDNSKLIRSVKSISVGVALVADVVTNPAAAAIQSCTALGGVVPTPGLVIGTAFVSRSDFVSVTNPIPIDDTIPQNTEGTQILSITYTAKKANSMLLITPSIFTCATTRYDRPIALFAGANTNAIAATDSRDTHVAPSESSAVQTTFTAKYFPGSTNAVTYTVRAGGGAGVNGCSARYFGGSAISSLMIQEIAQ